MVRWRKFWLCACLISCIFNVFIVGHGFVAGTQIETPGGFVPIEKLQVDDLVISRDRLNKTFVQKKVTHTDKKPIPAICRLTVSDSRTLSQIIVDPRQKFFLPKERKWRIAKNLKSGDLLLQNGVEPVTVTTIEKIEEETCVYELSVEDLHTYCISNQRVVAHNIFPAVGWAASAFWGYCGPTIVLTTKAVVSYVVSSSSFLTTLSPLTLFSTSFAGMSIGATVTPTAIVMGTATILKGVKNYVGSRNCGSISNRYAFPTTAQPRQTHPKGDRFSNPSYSPNPPANIDINPAPDPGQSLVRRWIPNYDSLSYKEKELAQIRAEYLEREANRLDSINNILQIPPNINQPSQKPTPPTIKVPPSAQPSSTNSSSSVSLPSPQPQRIRKNKQSILPTPKAPQSRPKTDPNISPRRPQKNIKPNMERAGIKKRLNHQQPGTPQQVVKQETVDQKSQAINTPLSGDIKQTEPKKPVQKEPGPRVQTPSADRTIVTTQPSSTSTTEPTKIDKPATKTRPPRGSSHPDKRPKKEVQKETKVCSAGGNPQMPGGPDDPRNPRNNGNNWDQNNNRYNDHQRNNPNDKSGPKVKPQSIAKWEMPGTIQVKRLSEAPTAVLSKYASDLSLNQAEKHVCDLPGSDFFGQVVGWQWYEGKVVLRADFDQNKGVHFNFKDSRPGKKANISIEFSGEISALEEFLATLNTTEIRAAVLKAIEEKLADKTFREAHPQKVVQYEGWKASLK